MNNEGFAIHLHHNILFEYCYDYEDRVAVIKSNKPKNEQKIRLRLFKMLSDEAIAELPDRIRKAYAEWRKAYAEWRKAYAEWRKAAAEWRKAAAEWRKAAAEWGKADAKWSKAYAKWGKAEQTLWHAKWCGCKEWNGKEIVFNKR